MVRAEQAIIPDSVPPRRGFRGIAGQQRSVARAADRIFEKALPPLCGSVSSAFYGIAALPVRRGLPSSPAGFFPPPLRRGSRAGRIGAQHNS